MTDLLFRLDHGAACSLDERGNSVLNSYFGPFEVVHVVEVQNNHLVHEHTVLLLTSVDDHALADHHSRVILPRSDRITSSSGDEAVGLAIVKDNHNSGAFADSTFGVEVVTPTEHEHLSVITDCRVTLSTLDSIFPCRERYTFPFDSIADNSRFGYFLNRLKVHSSCKVRLVVSGRNLRAFTWSRSPFAIL